MIIITVTASFNVLGSQVNTNGIISFQFPFTEFRPRRFPLNNHIPLIAPFWDDVDIRRSGNIFFRQTSNATLLQRARDQLRELFPSPGIFTPTMLFIATWDRVAPYFGGSEELQVSAYITILLLVTITTHCNNTTWRSRVSDIMGHYTWSAMENSFIIDVYVIVVPWVSRVYGTNPECT